jgi:hypothetical protein
MDFKYNIGDIVEVVNVGQLYSTYCTWAIVYNLTNYKKGGFIPSTHGDNCFGVVLSRGVHLSTPAQDGPLYGIRCVDTGSDYVIGEKGLQLVCDAPDNLTETLNDMIVEVCNSPAKEVR